MGVFVKAVGDDVAKAFIKKYGDDAIRAIAAHGDDMGRLALSNADDATKLLLSSGDDLSKTALNYGDDATKLMLSSGDDLSKTALSYTDDASKLLLSSGDDFAKTADALIKRYGKDAARALTRILANNVDNALPSASILPSTTFDAVNALEAASKNDDFISRLIDNWNGKTQSAMGDAKSGSSWDDVISDALAGNVETGYNGSESILQMLSDLNQARATGMTARDFALSKGVLSTLSDADAAILDAYDFKLLADDAAKGSESNWDDVIKDALAGNDETGYNGSIEGTGNSWYKADGGNNAQFTYKNNPMENPKAGKDIVEDPKAVYGFSPDPSSERIGKFAEFDWTNTDVVARAREARLQYHKDNESIYNIVKGMQHNGSTVEEIARAANQQRNVNRLQSYIDMGNMNGYEKAVESNMRIFHNKFGITADQAFAKYGSWDIVLEKAMRANAGMDACCGLYDDFYYLYSIGR